jgi:hypothetical protein
MLPGIFGKIVRYTMQWFLMFSGRERAGRANPLLIQHSTTKKQIRYCAVYHRTGSVQVTGPTYKAFWCVPEIGRWVKSVEGYCGNNGVRNERYTGELKSYKRSSA